ncbi:MAG: hypothetical protein GQ535_10630 [Rhodobacteraceae bacterium]|nr:hypothetical protein [Paracoccaceae bacterium]
MRIVLSIGAAVFVAACATSSTPVGGTCETRANAELTALKAAIQTSEQNLARGYALVRQLDPATGQVTEVQASVNSAKERQNLSNMQGRLGSVQAEADAGVAACG